MSWRTRILSAISVLGALLVARSGAADERTSVAASNAGPLDNGTLAEITELYHRLIDAENRHDLKAVATFVWHSPDALFVAKTATAAEGNWAGFWGTETVVHHLGELYSGTFVMDPDYSRVKTVGLTRDVALTYAPLKISVAYAGQTGTPKPFLMIVNWVRTSAGWKMATDIALPIPPAER